MTRPVNYGKLKTKTLNAETHKIWLTRNAEIDFCEPCGWSWQLKTDNEHLLKKDFAKKLLEISNLTDQQTKAIFYCVLDNYTFDDAGLEMNISKERVRQVVLQALRKIRWRVKNVFNMEIDIFEPSKVMTWKQWREFKHEHTYA